MPALFYYWFVDGGVAGVFLLPTTHWKVLSHWKYEKTESILQWCQFMALCTFYFGKSTFYFFVYLDGLFELYIFLFLKQGPSV
jgi:hypothetical protein